MTLAKRREANAILDSSSPTNRPSPSAMHDAGSPSSRCGHRAASPSSASVVPGSKPHGQAAGHGEVEEQGKTKTWSSAPAPVLKIGGQESIFRPSGHRMVAEHAPKPKTWSTARFQRDRAVRSITHVPGSITIALMWSQAKHDQSGQPCGLLDDTATGELREMVIARPVAWQVLVFRFADTRYVPWKAPHQDGPADAACGANGIPPGSPDSDHPARGA